MADITLLPSAKVPLIYSGDVVMTTEWYRFFWNVYGFTGDSSGAVPTNKGGTGFTSYANHDLLIGNSSGTLDKAQLSSSSIDISYPVGFINLELGTSGVTPGTYGSASQVGVFTVNAYGVLTAASNTSIGIDANQIVSGIIASARISGSYTGITGVGILTVGAWNATTIGTAYGGTGLTSFTSGGALYATSSSVLTSGTLPTTAGGTGLTAFTSGGALYATSTSALTSGTLPVTAGGTGQTSFTNGELLIGNTTGNTLTKATLTAGSGVSITNGAGTITISATGSGGTVTAVTGVAPIASSGGTTPAISISQSNTTTDGYLSATDWNTFNNKQPAGSYLTAVSVVSANGFAGTSSGGTTPALTLSTSITGILKGNGTAISAATSGTDYAPATSGTSILYGNGAGGFSNVTIGTGVSFAGGTLSATGTGGTVTSVSGTSPISVATGTTTPVISISQATTSTDGYLSSTDWNTFNNKQALLVSGTNIKTVNGTTLLGSGDLGTITTAYGGTGLSSYTAGDLSYYASGTSLSTLAIGAANTVLTSSGTAPQWSSGLILTSLTVSNGASATNVAINGNAGTILAIGRYSSDVTAPQIQLRKVRGTIASPTTVASGDLIGDVFSQAYDGTNLLNGTLIRSQVDTVTGAANINTNMAFFTRVTGGSAVVERMRIFGSGGVSIGNTTDPGATNLSVTGTVSSNGVVLTGNTGTVTSVAALTLGTTGTDLSSTVANSTTTPVITLNVPTASAANRGALSSTDWSTFNSKQAALVSGTNIKTVGGVSLLGSGDVGTIGVGYGGTGTATTFTAGSVIFAGASGVYTQDNSNYFWDNTNKRLGIGTTSPVGRIQSDVNTASTVVNTLTLNNNGGGGGNGVSINFYNSGASQPFTGRINSLDDGNYGYHMVLSNKPSGSVGAGALTERMRIFSSGGVSIGNTTDPGATNLSVTGTIAGSNVNVTSTTIPSNGIYLPSSNVLGFTSNGQLRASVNAGYFLLGTSTTPTYGTLAVDNSTGIWTYGPDSGGAFVVYCQPNIAGNYGVYIARGGTAWNAVSDERLKNIVAPIENAIEATCSLRSVYYTMKADESQPPIRRVGLIAQDVQKVLPEVINKNSDGYLGVAYSEIVPLLVAAIKEQQKLIETIQAKIGIL